MRDTDVMIGLDRGPAGGGSFPGLRDTPEMSDDEVASWELPAYHTNRTLKVIKRHGVVIDVQLLSD